ncbi:retropepsin-like aspartic protease family protein [Stieleria varia]|uniref:retropepsin-like aspartic protease family protein n=1 Tax=Stieleria varia TaxID=2528005 RepID=UPI001E367630|nr:retropepsin-like aspartic protease [Stieleria varia]
MIDTELDIVWLPVGVMRVPVYLSRGEGKATMKWSRITQMPLGPRIAGFVFAITVIPWGISPETQAHGDERAVEVGAQAADSTPKFSDAVVDKAESILKDKGLRRSGKVIQSIETAEISRVLATLGRKQRELRLVQQDWKKLADQQSAMRDELRRLNVQDGELNLQLANVAGVNTSANNRLVGLINATRAKMRLITEQKDQLQEQLAEKRKLVNQAEAEYADLVLAARADFRTLQDTIAMALQDEQVKIALKVMRANFDVPDDLTAPRVLSALDKRIERIEQEVFSESIALDVKGGSMYVNVVVGNKSARMVVDSGATLISLPAATAAELGVVVPPGARQLNLVMADGRTIPAFGVTLSRVRVGEFEAEDVDAAILDPSALNAEPLLGMSFLGNFKFTLDRDEKTLHIIRVKAE